MKIKFLLTAACFAFLSLTMVNAQIGTNYSNPCLPVMKGPNTLKTNKHVPHHSDNRFNSHSKSHGNGNVNAYVNGGVKNTNHPSHSIKKHRIQQQTKVDMRHTRKSHKHRDRGDKQ